jgi:hypothetical protein
MIYLLTAIGLSMPNEKVAKTIYKWKPYATRPKGRPRLRWEDDARNDLTKRWE